jgi:hypothetical protein
MDIELLLPESQLVRWILGRQIVECQVELSSLKLYSMARGIRGIGTFGFHYQGVG